MGKLDLYSGLKADLLTVTATKGDNTTMKVHHVALWRNNIEREKQEIPNLFPAVFIELMPADYKELTKGVQQYDMIVRLHICFESYKTEDTDMLRLVDAVFAKVHKKQYEYFGELLRIHDEQNYDHDNVQDFIQDYRTLGKDYGADKRATTNATVTTLEITPDKVDPNQI